MLAGLSRISEELRITSITSKAVNDGAASLTSAIIPDAIGVAMLVPSFSSYPVSASGRGAPGKDVPVAAVAEIIFEPYDAISGFSSSHSLSSPSSSRGPKFEKLEIPSLVLFTVPKSEADATAKPRSALAGDGTRFDPSLPIAITQTISAFSVALLISLASPPVPLSPSSPGFSGDDREPKDIEPI